MAILGLITLLAIGLFLCWNLHGNLAFVIPFRLKKILAIILVACAISTATILFQTISANRILTPGVMGFDSLFLMIKTLSLLLLGSLQAGGISSAWSFMLNTAVMALFSCLLYGRLITGNSQNLHLTVLAGIVLGALFRSLTSFFQSMIDPNTFLILQNSLFANFNNPDEGSLWITLVVLALITPLVFRRRHLYDVFLLGRETTINLGISYRRMLTETLLLITILVSVSTSLVGPVTFFGLLVSHLAYRLIPRHQHMLLIPAAAMLAVSALICGQFLLEHLLDFSGSLSMIIEFTGGIFFLIMLLRGAAK
jgi:iron complex transport system permease protein